MSKVIGPLFSLAAKGALKKTIVFQGSIKNGKVNKYRKQKDSQTERQLLIRTLFDEARQRWNALDSAGKEVWNEKAKGLNKTGYDFFISNSINNLRTMDYTKSRLFTVQKIKAGAKPPTATFDNTFFVLSFTNAAPSANEQYVFITFIVPKDWKPGSDFVARGIWYCPVETTGSVKWEGTFVIITPDTIDNISDTPLSDVEIVEIPPVAGQVKHTSGVAVSGSLFKSGDVVGIILKRKSADVEDTVNGDVNFIAFEIEYTSDRLGEKS